MSRGLVHELKFVHVLLGVVFNPSASNSGKDLNSAQSILLWRIYDGKLTFYLLTLKQTTKEQTMHCKERPLTLTCEVVVDMNWLSSYTKTSHSTFSELILPEKLRFCGVLYMLHESNSPFSSVGIYMLTVWLWASSCMWNESVSNPGILHL